MGKRGDRAWYRADKGEVHGRVLEYVGEIERVQSDIYDRFLKLAVLYDPHCRSGGGWFRTQDGQVTENVIASNCDAIAGTIAATEVRARFMTDDGDWSTQRTARHLEWYAEGLSKQLGIDDACRRAFHDGALKGTGVVKVFTDGFDEIRCERVMVDDIIVDEGECRGGKPRQMHQRVFAGRESLKAEFPEFEIEIERSQSGPSGGATTWRYWADYRPIERDELVCIESWYLPIGKPDTERYKPGRHTIVIDGCDLVDEEWHKPHFPFAIFKWTERPDGWYGIGGAERIAGHQRALNKINWQTDRQLDQLAVPTTYVRLADANLAVKTTNRLGTIASYKAEIPKTVIPPAVSGETYKRHDDIKSSSFEEFGQSRMAASAMKPAGIDSGVALREYKDQTTQRFASQEKGHEQLKLDAVWLAIDCAKDLGSKAPTIVRRSKHGPKKIPWSKVDMGEVRVQIAAASTLARTPAGRIQLALEWAQAGVISQDEARRLMRHPDTERSMSLHTAALEDIERCIEEMLDGEIQVPEPYQNLKLGVWRVQQAYLKARDDGAPEDLLENLRQWLTQAAWMVSQAEAPPPQVGAEMAAGTMAEAMPPMDPMQAAQVAGPPMGGDMGATMTGAGVMPANLLQ